MSKVADYIPEAAGLRYVPVRSLEEIEEGGVYRYQPPAQVAPSVQRCLKKTPDRGGYAFVFRASSGARLYTDANEVAKWLNWQLEVGLDFAPPAALGLRSRPSALAERLERRAA